MLRKLFTTFGGVEAKILEGLNVKICPVRGSEGKRLVVVKREEVQVRKRENARSV